MIVDGDEQVPAKGQAHEAARAERAATQREEQRKSVLLQGGAVLLDPVNAIEPAFELTHCRGRYHESTNHAEEKSGVVMLRGDEMGLGTSLT